MTTIAYLGPEHTNTHVAARTRFGPRATYVHAPIIDEVFHLVERRQAEYGVVPIENSLGGAVTHTLDRFIEFVDTPVKIQGEIEQPIQHYFIKHAKSRLFQIEVVYSHPQVFIQCGRWIQEHLSRRIHLMETNSTAEALRELVSRRRMNPWSLRERAAIGPGRLAIKGLTAIPIPEERENKTRFLILGLDKPPRGLRNKTSVLFALKDRPGALHDALVPFKRNRINLTKIESRPSKRKAWEYLFFIDVEGHVSEPRVKRALNALERSTSMLRVLGSYPVSARRS